MHALLAYLPTVPVHVTVLVKQDAVSGLAIPACPAALLVVALQGLGHGEVDHVPYVPFVDTHTESDRGTNDLERVGREQNRHAEWF